MFKVTVSYNDSPTPAVFENVHCVEWFPERVTLTVYTDKTRKKHYYYSWPRERIVWAKEEIQDD